MFQFESMVLRKKGSGGPTEAADRRPHWVPGRAQKELLPGGVLDHIWGVLWTTFRRYFGPPPGKRPNTRRSKKRSFFAEKTLNIYVFWPQNWARF